MKETTLTEDLQPVYPAMQVIWRQVTWDHIISTNITLACPRGTTKYLPTDRGVGLRWKQQPSFKQSVANSEAQWPSPVGRKRPEYADESAEGSAEVDLCKPGTEPMNGGLGVTLTL